MTREETKQIIGVMIACYPSYKPSDIAITVNAWEKLLEEYSYAEVEQALQTYITTDTSNFAPSVGKIIDVIHALRPKAEPQLNEMQAWDMVYKAINSSDYTKAFNELPQLVQKAVGSASALRNMGYDAEFNYGVEQSHFISVYRNVCKQANTDDKIPSRVKAMISTQNNAFLTDKGTK